MNWATTLRTWWNDLFYSTHTKHLEEEVLYLRNEIATLRLDKNLLQERLNSVNPAGQALHRRENPPKRPEQTAVAGPKRWAQLEAERYQEIAEVRRLAAEEKQKQAA